MKTKLSAEDKVRAKSKDLLLEKDGEQFKVFLKTKSGKHCIGESVSEQGAWQASLKFWGLN